MPTQEYAHISIHPTAVVGPGARIGVDTKVWHFSHIYADAEIGARCSFGQNTMVASGVRIGDNVKVQNNVAIDTDTTIEDDVFLGPSCVLTNVSNPRSQVVRQGCYRSRTSAGGRSRWLVVLRKKLSFSIQNQFYPGTP